MRLVFYGKLRQLYGHEVRMAASTVAEALEGFSRQQPDWPADMLVEAVGFDSLEKLKTAAKEVHLVPAMMGGGGKWGTIILGAVIVVAGFFIGGPVGIALMVSGGMMILQGVMNLFMKAPKSDKNAEVEGSKYLQVNKNTTAVGTPMTMAWGRIDLAGHWLSLQSDSNNISYGVFPTNPT